MEAIQAGELCGGWRVSMWNKKSQDTWILRVLGTNISQPKKENHRLKSTLKGGVHTQNVGVWKISWNLGEIKIIKTPLQDLPSFNIKRFHGSLPSWERVHIPPLEKKNHRLKSTLWRAYVTVPWKVAPLHKTKKALLFTPQTFDVVGSWGVDDEQPLPFFSAKFGLFFRGNENLLFVAGRVRKL